MNELLLFAGSVALSLLTWSVVCFRHVWPSMKSATHLRCCETHPVAALFSLYRPRIPRAWRRFPHLASGFRGSGSVR